MAMKNYNYVDWLRRCRKVTRKTGLGALGGPSPGGAAAELGITRQAVSNAIRRDSLDCVSVFDKNGQLMFVMVTEDSIEGYKKRQIGSGPKQMKQQKLQFETHEDKVGTTSPV